MGKVIAIGELLIDFVPTYTGCELKEVPGFEKAPGGAPANVTACVAKLGEKALMLSKVGEDAFGEYLIDVLGETGVDVSHIYKSSEANTALAFISLKQNGEREFAFYRKPSADMLLTSEEVDEKCFNEKDILHFCSVDLIDYPVKKAHNKALEIAKAKNMLVSFDPNVRLPLWEDHKAYGEVIRAYIPKADILKVSDEELGFITGIEDEERALDFLRKQVKMLIYTKGRDGAILITDSLRVEHKGYPIDAVDTTGAGDSFIGAILARLIKENIDIKNITSLTKQQAYDLLDFASKVAKVVVSRKGAMNNMPTYEEVTKF